MIRRPRSSTPFPSTTLSRLGVVVPPLGYSEADGSAGGEWVEVKPTGVVTAVAIVREPIAGLHPFTAPFAFVRSEEHTSELQSQSNIVCRLLLEKKKNKMR